MGEVLKSFVKIGPAIVLPFLTPSAFIAVRAGSSKA